MRPLLVLLALLFAPPTHAGEPMRYVHHPPESRLDHRYTYQWKILATALERTAPKWGPFTLEPSVVMTEKRQTHELRHATGKLTVMYLSTLPELERDLEPVRIPVDKNLGGYSVLLIRRENQRLFEKVRTIDDMRRFAFGLGLDWIDVDILRANSLNVVTGSSYDGLFEMLVNRRFDVLPRAAVEVLDEFAQRRRTMPDLHIEEHLVVRYPLPMYFWFAKTSEGKRLAARAREGMLAMIEDGTFDRIFAEFQDEKIQRLNLRSRRVLELRNPFVGDATPLHDKRLWFDPETYKGRS